MRSGRLYTEDQVLGLPDNTPAIPMHCPKDVLVCRAISSGSYRHIPIQWKDAGNMQR